MRKYCLFLVLIILMFLGTSVFAINNYFVTNSGSGAACSSGAPGSFSSCNGSSSVVTGTAGTCTSNDGLTSETGVGACIHVAPGNYSGPITTSKAGISGSRVMWVCDTKWACKISTANWSENASFVTVGGFDMTSPATGQNYGIGINAATQVHVIGNNFHDFDVQGCAQFGIINVGSGQAPNLAAQAIDALIKNNVIRHISSYTGTGPNVHSCITAHAVYDFGVRTLIYNNIMSASAGPAIERVVVTDENSSAGFTQGAISGNTLFNSGGGININESIDNSQGLKYDFSNIKNNIIVNNGTDDSISGGACGIDFFHATGVNNLSTNNLIYGNKPHDLCHHNQTQCGTDAVGSTPVTGVAIPPGGADTTGCPANLSQTDSPSNDPTKTFVNFQPDTPTVPLVTFTPNNYQIKSLSNAINHGASTTTCASAPGVNPCGPTDDFNNITRGGIPTIGAFEFIGSGGPSVSLNPTTLTFSTQALNTSSASKPVILTNNGSSTLSISSISISGDYSQTNNCPSTIGASISCTINVTFTPTATGTRNGTLSVTDNASGSPHTVPLTGTGSSIIAITSPTNINFGNQTLGVPSSVQFVTLTNTGTGDVTVGTSAIGGANASDFVFGGAGTCFPGMILHTGDTCTDSLKFSPTALGTRNGTETILDNSINSPHVTTLTGVGVNTAASISLSPTSLTFAPLLVGSTSAGQTVTITNNGTANLTITSISASGDFGVQ